MKLKDMLSDVLFTPNGTCPVCGRVLFSRNYFLCGSCMEDLPEVELETCENCGRGVAGGNRCKECVKAEGKAPDGGCVWLDYSGITQKLVEGMKFYHRRGLCVFVGKMTAKKVACQSWIQTVDVIVPVPLHPARLKERGYNQSLLMAEGLSEQLSQLYHASFFVDEMLVRVIDTPHQVGKGRRERLSNLQSAFKLKEDSEASGKNILLVDDVLTTGATTRACIDVLRQAGAAKVYIAVCAAVSDFSRA